MTHSIANASYTTSSMFLLLVVVASTLSEARAGTIFLRSGGGVGTWGGNCNGGDTCGGESTACALSAANPITITGQGHCEVVFLDNPGPLPVVTVNLPTTLTFRASSYVWSSDIYVQAPLTLRSQPGYKTAWYGSVTFNIMDATSSTLNISTFAFQEAFIRVMALNSLSSATVNFINSDILMVHATSSLTSFVSVGSTAASLPRANVVFSGCQFNVNNGITDWSLAHGDHSGPSGSSLFDVSIQNSQLYTNSPSLGGKSVVSSSAPSIRLTFNDSTVLTLDTTAIVSTAVGTTNEIIFSGAATVLTSLTSVPVATVKSGQRTLRVLQQATVQGFSISAVDIEIADASKIVNSLITLQDPNYLIVSSGSAVISLDDTITSPAAPSGNAVVFNNTSIYIAPSAHLSLSPASRRPVNSYYYWIGQVTVQSSSRGSGCGFDAGSALYLAADSKIRLACRTTAFDGIVGSVNASIEGIEPSAQLHVSGSSTYNKVAVDLRNFSLLTVLPLVNRPVETNASEFSGESLIVIGSAGNTRIMWPVTAPEPAMNTDAPLYLAEGNLPPLDQVAYKDYTDIYDFIISFVPRPSGKTLVNFRRTNATAEAPLLGPFTLPPDEEPFGDTNPDDMNPVGPANGAPSTSSPNTPSTHCPPPPPGFICSSNGQWTSTGNVSTGQHFIIPSGVTVKVNGSFSSNSSIIFQGTGQTLVIDGCLTLNNSGVVIDLTTSQWKPGTVTLIKQKENCPTSLDRLAVSVKQPKSGCKKVKSQIASSSNRSTLNVIFTSDNSGCNTKWIILGAVLAAVIVIALIVTIVVVLVINSKKEAKSREGLGG